MFSICNIFLLLAKHVLYLCVTAQPDVVVRDLTDDHEFLILACDGIWDVLSNQEVVDFVRGRIANKIEPETVRVALSHLHSCCFGNINQRNKLYTLDLINVNNVLK